jgi:hypothetical protein
VLLQKMWEAGLKSAWLAKTKSSFGWPRCVQVVGLLVSTAKIELKAKEWLVAPPRHPVPRLVRPCDEG